MKWKDCYACVHDPKVIRKNKLTTYIDSVKKELTELRERRDKKSNKFCRQEIIHEINKKVEDLKPYIEERSQLSKTISKNPMCEERYFRFLKEPKGVIPTMLQNLLDARKHTRVGIKENKKEIDKILEINGDKKKVNQLAMMNNVLDKRQLAYKICANSMYGSWGVKKGYLPFMPGAMCLLGDSLISHSFGFTRKMKDLVKTDNLWSYNNNGQVVSNGKGLIYKGKKEIVRITLIDGRILKCTPDHKIMTTTGWVEAGKLLPKHNWDGEVFKTNIEFSKVIVGLELPEDIIGKDEKNWKLLDYSMETPKNREKMLAFCRVLGFILSDGSISKYLGSKTENELLSCKVCIGTLLDSKNFVNDIKILTGQEPMISYNERVEIKGNVFNIHVPKILADKIILIDGVLIGKRTHQPFTLPSFIFEPDCPLSVAREFLGGLFGGDGTSPSLSVSHPSFSPVEFGISTIEKYKNDMFDIMNKLIILLERFDMKFWLREPRLSREREELLPKDIKENPRWEYLITTNNCFSLLFAQKIGFRYCSDKSNKLTVTASYQRYSDNVKKQHIDIVLKASEMFDLHDKHYKTKYILEKARKEIYENEIPLHEYFSLSKCAHVYNYRAKPHTLEGFKLLQKYFPTAREYSQMTGCDHWFSEEQKSKKIYSLERDQESNPCLYIDVVDVRYDGVDDVYDIIDVPNQSFIANGIVVHNCTTFMGRTNIEIVAKTIVEEYKGELVYGDTDCVLATEPVLVMNDGIVDYKTVEELSDGIWTRINPNKEISNVKKGLMVWSDNGFTNIINVVRCGVKKPLSRVLTHIGVINCSNEHSLLTDDLKSVTPLDIKIGDKLCVSELPLPSDTPKNPVYNNKVAVKTIEDYVIPNVNFNGLTAELSFVWGLFYADGSCGQYLSKTGYNKSTWAINNQDNKLLNRVCCILKKHENSLDFKILDTMESSSVNKLVAIQFSKKLEHRGTIVNFVDRYRNLFYDSRKYKKIPTIIFNAPFGIRQSFYMGYHAGDGSRKDPALCLSNKGAIGSAGLFYLLRSIGYQVSVNTREDKPHIYKLTGSTPEKGMRYIKNAVKKIITYNGNEDDYIYDIQTENHHFAAGVGQLVVHNSNYIHFPHLKNKTASEAWDYALDVAEKISSLFPRPIKLDFEEALYERFFILTKKRYMYKACGQDGIVSNKIGRRGVLLNRRDSSVFVRNLYEKVVTKIMDREDRDEILYFILQEINRLCSNSIPYKDFVVTKSVGNTNNFIESDDNCRIEGESILEHYIDEKGKEKIKIGDYIAPKLPKDPKEREKQFKLKDARTIKEYYERCLPAQVQLAEKMKRRGQLVQTGSRLEFLVTDIENHTAKQYEKLESMEYFLEHSSFLTVDFFYYIKIAINSIDEILNIAFLKNDGRYSKPFKKDFVKEQYIFRYKKRRAVIEQIKNLFKPKISIG